MKKIFNVNFDTGIERIVFNGDPDSYIDFNAHDMSFPDKFNELNRYIMSICGDLESTRKLDYEDSAAKWRYIGDEVTKRFDEAFGKDSCKRVFYGINPLTYNFNNNGDISNMLITKFIEGMTPYMEEKFNALEKLEKKQRQKYTNQIAQFEDAYNPDDAAYNAGASE